MACPFPACAHAFSWKCIIVLASIDVLKRWRARTLVLSIMVTVFLGSILVCAFPYANFLNSPTLTVPDNYPTIQAAVNAASDGDAISVRSVTYSEHVGIGKAFLSLAKTLRQH
jgi:hypothetical protein